MLTKEHAKTVYQLNLLAERQFRDFHRAQGWSEKQIAKALERLEHIKLFQEAFQRAARENALRKASETE